MTEATEKDLKDLGAAVAAWRDVADKYTLKWDAELVRRVAAERALCALRQQVEDTIGTATIDVDADDWIVAYHFKTGAIHRLLGVARDPAVDAGTVYQAGIAAPQATPSNPSDLASSLTREREENQRLEQEIARLTALLAQREPLPERDPGTCRVYRHGAPDLAHWKRDDCVDWIAVPCPHSRPTWRGCPHCLGLNEGNAAQPPQADPPKDTE